MTQQRTFPFGTKYRVQVLSSSPRLITVLTLRRNETEGFLLLDHGLNPPPKPGTKGSITFVEGGPTGGHWEFKPDHE